MVVQTKGRRVVVRDAEGERVCFLSGQRAVVGDRVQWVEARGEGGKLMGVDPRDTALERVDFNGRTQVLAANVGGLLVVTSPNEPPFRPGLVDRYMVAGRALGLDVAVVLNKVDQGVSDEVDAALALRAAHGIEVFRTQATTADGVAEVQAFLGEVSADRPWVLVGHSGVGKTSLMAALLPEEEVGAVGEISAHWGTGQHTTTYTRLFGVPGGGQLVDSPGIRTFSPAGIDSATARDHFPGVGRLGCHYRDCLHRPGEEGCVAEEEVPEALLVSYRRLLSEVLEREDRVRQRERR